MNNEIFSNIGNQHNFDMTLSPHKAATVWFNLDSSVKVVDFDAFETHCMHNAQSRSFVIRQGETKQAYTARISAYIEAVSC